MKHLFIALLMIAGYSGYSQFSIGANIGPSIATGAYGDTDIDNNESGFAGSGVVFNIEGDYLFTDMFGVSFVWGGAAHPVDEQAMATEIGIPSSRIDADAWSFGYLMVGPALAKSTDNFDLVAYVRLGFISSTSPLTITDIGTAESEESELGLGSSIGVNYTYYFNQKLGLQAGLDLTGGTVAYEDYDQPHSTVNLKFGLRYRFYN